MTRLARPDPDRPDQRLHRGGRPGRSRPLVTVRVTERALSALVDLRAAEHAAPGQALGLIVGPTGSIELVLDLPGANDRVFSRGDTPILFIDADLGPRLADRVFDYRGEAGHERFTLDQLPSDSPPPKVGPPRP